MTIRSVFVFLLKLRAFCFEIDVTSPAVSGKSISPTTVAAEVAHPIDEDLAVFLRWWCVRVPKLRTPTISDVSHLFKGKHEKKDNNLEDRHHHYTRSLVTLTLYRNSESSIRL